MSKIIINGNVSSSNDKECIKDIKAIYKDDKITYKLNEILVNITINNDIVTITRESKDMMINLKFKENKNLLSKYFIKDLGVYLKVETKTKKLVISNNFLNIEYDLFINDEFSDSFAFTLEWRRLT